MEIVLFAVVALLLTGVVALALGRSKLLSSIISVLGISVSCALGLVAVVETLLHGTTDSLSWPWNLPAGSFTVGLDPLSALFLLIIFGLSIPVSIYGASYLWHHRDDHNLGVIWFFTTLLIASMATVVIARNAVLFLVAWELMSVSSYFLVTVEHSQPSVRRAGMIYLIAAHIGAAFLLLFFLSLGHGAANLDFASFSRTPQFAGWLFILALIGFGSKAGFIPLHVWLPEAHPAAPSHISALMSGVMIKIGIYGLLRAMTLLGPPQYWWGVVLIAVGLVTAILGVLLALAQSDIKRLLAYSSVENMGIVAVGIGIGVLGWVTDSNTIAALGFAGALLHVVNHSMFKGALFLGAGSVLQRCGTLRFDELGGLIKRMPHTTLVMVIASASIVGLPIGNGFISEFLLFVGALNGASSTRTDLAAISVVIVIGLALIGGLALVCFTKLIGIGFLGAPRSESAATAHESSKLMTVPMMIMAFTCVAIGLTSFVLPPLLGGLVASVTGMSTDSLADVLKPMTRMLSFICGAAGVLLFLILLISLIRRQLLRSRSVTESVTWDCGYAAPNVRMQYGGYSFVQNVMALFEGMLSIRKRTVAVVGSFPRRGLMAMRIPDAFLTNIYEPVFRRLGWVLGQLRWLQHGNVHIYILYIMITLLLLLFWKLR